MLIHANNEKEFQEAIKGRKVLVDFFAVWCGPCSRMSPIIEKLSEELSDVVFVKVDVDEVPEVAAQFNVMSIPTLVYFEDGKPVRTQVGFTPEPLLRNFLGL